MPGRVHQPGHAADAGTPARPGRADSSSPRDPRATDDSGNPPPDGPTSHNGDNTPSSRGDSDGPAPHRGDDAPATRGDADAPPTHRGDADAPAAHRGDSDAAPTHRADADAPSTRRGDSDAPAGRRGDSDAPSTRRPDDAPSTRTPDDAPSTRTPDGHGTNTPDAPRTPDTPETPAAHGAAHQSADHGQPHQTHGDSNVPPHAQNQPNQPDVPPQPPHTYPQHSQDPNRPIDDPVPGHVGQDRHTVQPNRHQAFDPTGQLRARLASAVGDNPLRNVRDWIRRSNPHFNSEAEAFTNNCGDASRAFADTLQGRSPRLAHGDLRDVPGERREMYEFTGVRPVRIEPPNVTPGDHAAYTREALDAIRRDLEGRPPGTVAIVGGAWHPHPNPDGTIPRGGGHWFNAFVDHDGVVRWADNQSGRIADSPQDLWPTKEGFPKPTFDELEAMVREPGGSWTSPVAPSYKVDAMNTPPPVPNMPPVHQPVPNNPYAPQPGPYNPGPAPQPVPNNPYAPPPGPYNPGPAPQPVPNNPYAPPPGPHNPGPAPQPVPNNPYAPNTPTPHQPMQPVPSTPHAPNTPAPHAPQQPHAPLEYTPPQPPPLHTPHQPVDAPNAPAPHQPVDAPNAPAPHQPVDAPNTPAPQQPHAPLEYTPPQPPPLHTPHQPTHAPAPHQPVDAPNAPHQPEASQPHPHQDGKVPEPGEVGRRMDPEGRTDQPAPTHQQEPAQPHPDEKVPAPGDIERALDPEGRFDQPGPTHHQDAGPSRIERALDPEGAARWDRDHADPRTPDAPTQPHAHPQHPDAPTPHRPDAPTPHQPEDPRVWWSQGEHTPGHAEPQSPSAHQQGGRPEDPRVAWSERHQPTAHQPAAHHQPSTHQPPTHQPPTAHHRPGDADHSTPHQQPGHADPSSPHQQSAHPHHDQQSAPHDGHPARHDEAGQPHDPADGDRYGSTADQPDGDRWGSSASDDGVPPGERAILDEIGRDVDTTLHDHPEVAEVIKKLTADDNPLNMTNALRDPATRQATLDILKELADGRVLGDRSLLDFLRDNHRSGGLFERIPEHVNDLPNGVSRKDAFVQESQLHDPVRSVGPDPTPEEMLQVRDYRRRLAGAEPVVKSEVERLVDDLDADVNVRTKGAAGLIDKVQRMTSGTDGRAPRPNYKVGDVIDAIGARITVNDTADLAKVVDRVREYFGFGDEGRILEVENMYAQPKAHNPGYRVVPMIVKVDSGGQVYTFELQLTTRRASIAADVNHNTIYKPHIDVTPEEQAKVARMFDEAAALEQIENRGLNNG